MDKQGYASFKVTHCGYATTTCAMSLAIMLQLKAMILG